MAKWAHSDVLDKGPDQIKQNANSMRLISAYAAGDSYATVLANTLAAVSMAPSDYVFSSSGSNRVLTTASGKTGTASAGAAGTPDLHLAFVDTANSKVLWVTNEASDQPIVSGNPVSFPSVSYTSQQPV